MPSPPWTPLHGPMPWLLLGPPPECSVPEVLLGKQAGPGTSVDPSPWAPATRPSGPRPPTLCPTLKRAQLPFKCPTCKHPTEKCAGGTRGSPGARLDVTSDLPALEATTAPTGERLISCCCSGLWLGRTGLAWGTHTAPPPSFSLIVLCTGLNHVPHKIHVPPRSSECNLLWK